MNAQQAAALAGHADLAAHARYLANTSKMRRVPKAALPALEVLAARVPELREGESGSRMFSAPPARVELATNGLGRRGYAAVVAEDREIVENAIDDERRAETAAGQSGGNASPRERMIAALNAELGAALEAGDIEAARIAHEALGRLLGAAATGAPVLDLARERTRRGGRS